MKTFIIAEAGSNHNRNFKQAISLIDVAKEANASAVKFQTYSSETLYTKNTPDFAGHTNISKLIKDIEIPREWQPELKSYCDEVGIEFMSTPFDESAVDELVFLGVKKMKIAGFESTDFRFVDMVASTKLPLIISLGIGFKDEHLNTLLNITSKYGNDLTLLHCNNAYPTPMEDANLNTIKKLLKMDMFKVGFSDHTKSVLTPALAVAAGAVAIEKHYTLSKRLPGPDHPFAVEPHELKKMIQNIEECELAMGIEKEEYSKSEMEFIKGRRSVVAKTNINVGDTFTLDNITTKRPFLNGCIPASDFYQVIGKTSTETYQYDDFIRL